MYLRLRTEMEGAGTPSKRKLENLAQHFSPELTASVQHSKQRALAERKHSGTNEFHRERPGAVAAHLCDPSIHREGRARKLTRSLRPAWSTCEVPGQPGIHSQTLSQKTKNEKVNKFEKSEMNPDIYYPLIFEKRQGNEVNKSEW